MSDWVADEGWRGSHDELLTYERAADYLGLSYSRIADLVHRGVLHPEPPPPNYPNRKLKLLRLSELDWYNTQRPKPNLTPTLADLGIAPGGVGMVSYEQAAQALGLSTSDLAALVRASTLHPNAHNRLRSDEVNWYKRVRDGEDAGKNPALQTEQALAQREAEEASQPQPLDTLAILRQYVEQHMAGSEEVGRLDALLAKVAGHVAVTLALSTAVPLPEEERTRLFALLSALTQKGR